MQLNSKEEIKKCLDVNSTDKNIEFEVRYGNFNSNSNFSAEITLENFVNLCNYLNINFKFLEIEYSLVVNHKDKTRVTQFLDSPINNEILSYPWKGNKVIGEKIIKKRNIKNIDDTALNLRFSLSEELPVNETSLLYSDENPAVYFKLRKRFIYTLKNMNIELSMFKSSDNINNLETKEYKYDVEVEVNKTKISIEELQEQVFSILKVIQNTFMVMKTDEIENVKNEYFKLTNKRKFIGCQPETLRVSKLSKNEKYSMTLKLDGKRYLLLVYNNKCYLIDNKFSVCKIDLKLNRNCDNTLIDGELINHTFHCFDILYIEGCDVKGNIFSKRQEQLSKMLKIFENTDNNSIVLKEYIKEDIYNNMIKYLDNNNNLKDNTIDGFILVTDKIYEIAPLKWKPEILNTIDFKINKLNKNEKYEEWLLLCSDGNKDIPFSVKDLSKVKIRADIAINFMDNTVVEFYYDKNKEQFCPYKTRYDKIKGNYIKVAEDNFDTIMYPFDLKILEDTSYEEERKNNIFFNMRRFHNWIKRYLLEKYCSKSGNLLDLACGKGGDIFKWVDNNIRYVEGYDINEKSIEEAQRRYSKVVSKPTSKNFDYHFEVKDLSSEIVSRTEKFDLITCFFAMHYFYKNEDILENFIENLKNVKENSYIIMTTLSAEKLKEIDYTLNTENLKINKVNIDENKKLGNSIKVYIKDSVLNEETEEYIVDYKYTVELMESKGYNLVESKLFNEYYPLWKENENFLSFKEKEYSFLNRTYVFVKSSQKNKEKVQEKTKEKTQRKTKEKKVAN